MTVTLCYGSGLSCAMKTRISNAMKQLNDAFLSTDFVVCVKDDDKNEDNGSPLKRMKYLGLTLTLTA